MLQNNVAPILTKNCQVISHKRTQGGLKPPLNFFR